MFRFVLRLGGLVLLAGAFSLFVADATRAIAAGGWAFTSVRVLVEWLSATWIDRLKTALEALHPFLWDPIANLLMQAPAFLALGAAALLFLFLGAKPSSQTDG